MHNKLRIIYFICCLIFLPGLSRTEVIVFDDFNQASGRNYFGGFNDKWINSGLVRASYCNDPAVIFGNTGYSMKISYNVYEVSSYNGFSMKMDGKDISGYSYFSFWVKGEKGGEFFRFDISDKDQAYLYQLGASRFYISDFLDKGVTTEWQKVVVPLDSCVGNEQLTNMWEFNIVFEHDKITNNHSHLVSVIYLDDLLFGTWDPGYVRLDPNGDHGDYWPTWDGSTALGGQLADMEGGAATIGSEFTNCGEFSVNAGPYQEKVYSYCMMLDYDVTDPWSFVGIWNRLGGGPSGQKSLECDFNDYDYFTFITKARSAAENPKRIKIEIMHNAAEGLDPANPWSYNYYVDITTNWTKYSLNLSSVPTKTNINMYSFVLEQITITNQAVLGSMQGVIIIDNIQIEKAGYKPDIIAPKIPSLFKSDNTLLKNGFVFGSSNNLSIMADSETEDASIEALFFEYSLDNGSVWYRIKTDYDTADNEYRAVWMTTNLKNMSCCLIQAYAMDANGNKSIPVTYSSWIENAGINEYLIKPDQRILTPNGDGVNDDLVFEGLRSDFEISIYNLNSRLIRRIMDVNYWDGKDSNAQTVEGGIYIYVVKKGNETINGSILIIK